LTSRARLAPGKILAAARLRVANLTLEASWSALRDGPEVTECLQWFFEQVEAAATAAEQTVPATLATARFWPMHQAAALNERQRKLLTRLLDAGPDDF
jgi:hypothetical protein